MLETMRRQEPASSPSMKSVLHLEVPGHLARVGVRGWRVFEGFLARRARALSGEPAEEDVLRELAQMHDVRRRLAADLAQRLAWLGWGGVRAVASRVGVVRVRVRVRVRGRVGVRVREKAKVRVRVR